MKIRRLEKNGFKYFALCFLFFCEVITAQTRSFKLKSKVELRSWTLNSKAIKNSTFVNGATVELFKATGLVAQTMSDGDGNFEMNIPLDGDFTLLIKSEGSNPKKFAVSTRGASPDKSDANLKPSISIVGIIMARPIGGVKYLGLTETHVLVEYSSDKTDEDNKRDYSFSQNIYDGEYLVIQKFCTANKLGDIALENKNYALAQIYYLMAEDIMPGEAYPKAQIKKAEEGLKLDKDTAKQKLNKANSRKQKVVKAASQVIATKPKESTEVKSTTEKGKPSRKIRKTLCE